MGSNNGQKGFINEEEHFLNEGNTISFGQDTATMFYQENPYFTGDKIKILKSKDKRFNKKNALFFILTMSKAFSSFSWGASSFNVKIIESQKIQLPTKNGKIDFEFMESFLAELEAERIAELEAYLSASGLKDYTLTAKEQQVFEKFEKGKVKFEEFEIQTLFAVSPSKAYAMNDGGILLENGKTPYVSNQSQNNGYIGWSNLTPLNPSNVITLSDTWQSERTIFYQATEFIGKSHLQVMKPYDTKFQKFELFFVISSFRKAILEMNYDYGTKFNRGKINTTKIQLPTINNKIDYALMRTFISAIQKLVIKDVVLYADRKIATTKTVANK
jgi:hypothetical protein